MVTRTTVRVGGMRVDVEDGMQAAINRTIERLAGDVLRPMEQAAEAQLEETRRQWPDKGDPKAPRATGKSKGAFAIERVVTVNPDTGQGDIRVSVVNGARSPKGFAYARVIRSRTAGTTGSQQLKRPWVEFLTKPMRKRAKVLRRELTEAIGDLLKGRR